MAASTSPRSPRRAPVSPARLLVRRVGALAVVVVVAWSLVQAVTAFVGDDDPVAIVGETGAVSDGQSPGDAESAAGLAGSALDVGSAQPVVTPDGDESSTPASDVAPEAMSDVEPTEAASTVPPSPSDKARVYIVGDSDAGTFGPYLQQLLDGTNIVETELNYKVSSGLARPDFYNWPVELAAALPAADPDIVVATFGGNDAQGLSLPGDELEFIIGDPVANEAEWSAEYQRRAGEVMDLLLEDGRSLIWVGIPNDDNPDVTARLAIQDQAVRAAAAERPEVVFIDTWKRFSGRDGGWAEFVIDPRDGTGKDVRADDGFHLNVNGAEILALDIAQAVRDDLRARGANI